VENYPSLMEMCNNSTIALKTSLAVSFKSNIHFLMILEIPLLVTHPEVVKTRICIKTFTRMLLATLLIIAPHTGNNINLQQVADKL